MARGAGRIRLAADARRPAAGAGRLEPHRIRKEQGWMGSGPSVVVTDLGIHPFDDSGEMRLDSLHPRGDARGGAGEHGLGGPAGRHLAESPAPTADELRLMREQLDPAALYAR